METQSLSALAESWRQAKLAEQQANAQRLAIEEQIIAITGKRDEGSKTHDADGYKVTVTGKISRKMDWTAWEAIKGQIPAELHPVKMKPELDEKGVKWLADNKPDIYRLLPIEVKPAKTAVDIKSIEVAA